MLCPFCASTTQVTNSRKSSAGTEVWRRRKCRSCSQIFTTFEAVDLQTSHKVTHNTGHTEPLSRDKLHISIMSSLQHRKTALKDASYLTDIVLKRILLKKSAIVVLDDLSRLVHSILVKFDPVAASVYAAQHHIKLNSK